MEFFFILFLIACAYLIYDHMKKKRAEAERKRSCDILSHIWCVALAHAETLGRNQNMCCIIDFFAALYYCLWPLLDKAVTENFKPIFSVICSVHSKHCNEEITETDISFFYDYHCTVFDDLRSRRLDPLYKKQDLATVYRIAYAYGICQEDNPPYAPLDCQLDFAELLTAEIEYLARTYNIHR